MGVPRAQSRQRVSAPLCIIHGVLYKLMVFQSERRNFGKPIPSPVKKHTNLCKYWNKWRRCFLRYSKYCCQVYCVVFSATTQKCKRIGVFEMVCLTLEGIRCIVPMPKEQWHTEKAAEKMLFWIKHLYHLTKAAVPGTGARLDSRSCKNGGLRACMGLFAVEKLSLSSQEVQNRIVTRNSLHIHCMIVLN